MSRLTAFEVKDRFAEVLDRVVQGEEIVITRHNETVARIVPDYGATTEQIHTAVQAMRQLRERMAARKDFAVITDEQIREAKDHGRP